MKRQNNKIFRIGFSLRICFSVYNYSWLYSLSIAYARTQLVFHGSFVKKMRNDYSSPKFKRCFDIWLYKSI